jgi:hypothetical protein
MFPEVETISFQSDNGAAYASPFLLFMIQPSPPSMA